MALGRKRLLHVPPNPDTALVVTHDHERTSASLFCSDRERKGRTSLSDSGPNGDSSGDLLTFANDVFDETNTAKVGRDQGDCIRINVTAGSWECRWITFLKGGAITVEGPFFDAKDSVLAITGGRGKYKDARGSMELKALPDLSGYDFIFHLIA